MSTEISIESKLEIWSEEISIQKSNWGSCLVIVMTSDNLRNDKMDIRISRSMLD